MDGRQLPFPEELPINRETLLHYAAAFLSGRLQSSLDARKAMVASRPFSTHNTVRRKDKRVPPTEVRGVSEQFKPQDVITQASLPAPFKVSQEKYSMKASRRIMIRADSMYA